MQRLALMYPRRICYLHFLFSEFDFSVLDSISMSIPYESSASPIRACVEIKTKHSGQFVGQRKEEREGRRKKSRNEGTKKY